MKPILPSRGTFRGIINYYSNKGKLQNVFVDASNIAKKESITNQSPIGHWSSESNGTFSQWFSINIDNKKILYNAYSIYTLTGMNCYSRSWDVYISNDNLNWIKFDEKRDDDSLNGAAKTFILQHPTYGKYIKVVNRGYNGCSSTSLHINEFELFGYLNPLIGCYTKYNKSRISNIIIIFISIIYSN